MVEQESKSEKLTALAGFNPFGDFSKPVSTIEEQGPQSHETDDPVEEAAATPETETLEQLIEEEAESPEQSLEQPRVETSQGMPVADIPEELPVTGHSLPPEPTPEDAPTYTTSATPTKGGLPEVPVPEDQREFFTPTIPETPGAIAAEDGVDHIPDSELPKVEPLLERAREIINSEPVDVSQFDDQQTEPFGSNITVADIKPTNRPWSHPIPQAALDQLAEREAAGLPEFEPLPVPEESTARRGSHSNLAYFELGEKGPARETTQGILDDDPSAESGVQIHTADITEAADVAVVNQEIIDYVTKNVSGMIDPDRYTFNWDSLAASPIHQMTGSARTALTKTFEHMAEREATSPIEIYEITAPELEKIWEKMDEILETAVTDPKMSLSDIDHAPIIDDDMSQSEEQAIVRLQDAAARMEELRKEYGSSIPYVLGMIERLTKEDVIAGIKQIYVPSESEKTGPVLTEHKTRFGMGANDNLIPHDAPPVPAVADAPEESATEGPTDDMVKPVEGMPAPEMAADTIKTAPPDVEEEHSDFFNGQGKVARSFDEDDALYNDDLPDKNELRDPFYRVDKATVEADYLRKMPDSDRVRTHMTKEEDRMGATTLEIAKKDINRALRRGKWKATISLIAGLGLIAAAWWGGDKLYDHFSQKDTIAHIQRTDKKKKKQQTLIARKTTQPKPGMVQAEPVDISDTIGELVIHGGFGKPKLQSSKKAPAAMPPPPAAPPMAPTQPPMAPGTHGTVPVAGMSPPGMIPAAMPPPASPPMGPRAPPMAPGVKVAKVKDQKPDTGMAPATIPPPAMPPPASPPIASKAPPTAPGVASPGSQPLEKRLSKTKDTKPAKTRDCTEIYRTQFRYASARLQDSNAKGMIIEYLRNYVKDGDTVHVHAFADTIGSEKDNIRLTRLRALSLSWIVKTELKKLGKKVKVKMHNYGEVGPEVDAEEWARVKKGDSSPENISIAKYRAGVLTVTSAMSDAEPAQRIQMLESITEDAISKTCRTQQKKSTGSLDKTTNDKTPAYQTPGSVRPGTSFAVHDLLDNMDLGTSVDSDGAIILTDDDIEIVDTDSGYIEVSDDMIEEVTDIDYEPTRDSLEMGDGDWHVSFDDEKAAGKFTPYAKVTKPTVETETFAFGRVDEENDVKDALVSIGILPDASQYRSKVQKNQLPKAESITYLFEAEEDSVMDCLADLGYDTQKLKEGQAQYGSQTLSGRITAWKQKQADAKQTEAQKTVSKDAWVKQKLEQFMYEAIAENQTPSFSLAEGLEEDQSISAALIQYAEKAV